MSSKPRSLLVATVLAVSYSLIFPAASVVAQPSAVDSTAGSGAVAGPSAAPREMFSPDGTITRVEVAPEALPGHGGRAFGAVSATVTPVEVNGPSSNRIDIVFMGDGYLASEIGTFGDQVGAAWALLANREPFRTNRTMFNVWRVDVVSPVSGVSGDPTADVVRDTPLQSTYWCAGLERLLCTDITKVYEYAALAPGADQIAVLANSGMYGGAGYTTEEVVTFAGGHPLGGEIFPHELGHSLGNLADEYPYWAFPGDGSVYDGPEPIEANVSTYDAATMTSTGAKWWYWLGTPTPDGGVTDTLEGGYYTEFGIYRPSDNSLMRNLLREFNTVGREEMIKSFYETVRPIDSVSPSTATVGRNDTVTIQTIGVPLTIRWYVGGHEMPQWRGKTAVNLRTAPRRSGVLTVRVSDPTSWVRNPVYRSTQLSQERSWQIR